MAGRANKLQPVPVWLGRLHAELRHLAMPALSGRQTGPLSISFEVPLAEPAAPPANASGWLYWHQPDRQYRLLGLGMAHVIRARGGQRFRQLETAYRCLQTNWTRVSQGRGRASAWVFVGFAFDPEFQPEQGWVGFDNAGLYLPQLMFEWKKGRCVLTFNCYRDQDTLPEKIIADWVARLRSVLFMETARSSEQRSRVFLKTELPAASDWRNNVAHAIAAMKANRFDKVVLTRQLQLRFGETVPHREMLSSLAQHYPRCTQLSVNFGHGTLLAATPEQLFDMSAQHLHCDALAGTFPAHQARPDAQMEIHEHAPVVQAIRDALHPLCTELKADQAAVPLALRSLSHLYTPVHAVPRSDVHPLQVLDALHPTPAVGGLPKESALAWIREYEQLPRGWYTGAFGWLGDHQEARMSVILRCALIHENVAQLYAGGGITRVSDPDQELRETELKFEPMLNALLH
ncbi:MAG TPA: isochorismate synthase [Chromatiaceae bacterium]|nr:isochorismate synthase [Chromatiaceae bacterium]